jgi:RNA polymerase sigma-70 factor (ECF subfamily)
VFGSSTNKMRFREAFDDYFDAITRYCFRRLPQSNANDAAASVFVVVWRKIDEMPEGDETLPWLYGVARNEVRTFRRSLRRSTALRVKLSGQPTYPPAGPEAVVIRNDEQAQLVRALNTLGSSDQEILRLRAYENLQINQIATVLGCTPEAAKKRCSRATKRLRDAVDRSGRRRAPTRSRAIPEGGDG